MGWPQQDGQAFPRLSLEEDSEILPLSSWPGEVPAIHADKPPPASTIVARPDVDARDEPGHDD